MGWGSSTVIFHYVDFLHVSVKLDRLTTLGFSAGAGFVIFVWPLCGVFPGVLLEYFTILILVSGYMHKSCVSCTSHLLTCREYIFCLALASAALLGVGRLGGFSSLSFPGVVITVGICS